MMNNPYLRSSFVVFEGVNGGGKSTQAEKSHAWHVQTAPDIRTVLTKEPYTKTPDGRPVHSGNEIYQILRGEHKRTRLAEVTPEAFQRYFYFPNRISHHLEVVIPSLEEGALVLSDRGLASVCFGAQSVGALYYLMAEQLAMYETVKLPWPDAIIIYDVPAEVAMQRMRDSGKALDGHESLEIQERVCENYRVFARNWPNCHIVDGTASAEEVFRKGTLPILDRAINREMYRIRDDQGVIY